MQISTIHKLQHALDTFIKVCKFVWRHACVLFVTYPLIRVLLSFKMPVWSVYIQYVSIAAVIDWIKMKPLFRPSAGYRSSNNVRSDMFHIGSASWNSNPAKIGSLAYNMNQMSSSSRYYR